MAVQRRIYVRHGDVFAHGAYILDAFGPVADFNAPPRPDGSRAQSVDKENGLSAAASISDAAEALTSASQTLAPTDPRLEAVASSHALASDNLMRRVMAETPPTAMSWRGRCEEIRQPPEGQPSPCRRPRCRSPRRPRAGGSRSPLTALPGGDDR